MEQKTITLSERLESGKTVIVAELHPPRTADVAAWQSLTRKFKGKVHAIGISDNREHIGMSAMAAASLAIAEGVSPILHMVTRDRNRIALISDVIGAKALGIENILCTTGTHQTLGEFGASKNVYDLDTIQLLKACSANGVKSSAGALLLGATASPYADPAPLQMIRLRKKLAVGAKFLITQPVFDLDRFSSWWQDAAKIGIPKQTAVIAGILPLLSADEASKKTSSRPSPRIPERVLTRIRAEKDPTAQRKTGIAVAVETIQKLKGLSGLRGFEIGGRDPDAILEILEKSGLESR